MDRKRWPGWLGIVVLVSAAGALVFRITAAAGGREGSESPAILWISMLVTAALILFFTVLAKRKAQRFKARLQAEHPGAFVVDTFWSAQILAPFLTPGHLRKQARGHGFSLCLIANGAVWSRRPPARTDQIRVS